jgi:hypothetical protein
MGRDGAGALHWSGKGLCDESAGNSKRRHFLRSAGLGATIFAVPGAFAEELAAKSNIVLRLTPGN